MTTMTVMWDADGNPLLQAAHFAPATGGMPEREAQRNLCRKFSTKGQQEMAAKIVDEFYDGSLYRGDWTKGEIQIVSIAQIIACRFWLEVVYNVLFVPKRGTEPVRGTYRNLVWVSGVDSGAGALCITPEGEIVLVHCFRHATRRWCWELPRGNRVPGESLEDCGCREAEEEVGAALSEGSRVIDLGVIDADTGALRQEPRIIAITEVTLTGKSNRDVSESVMTARTVSPAEFMEMVRSGDITCAWAMTALVKAIAHGLVRL